MAKTKSNQEVGEETNTEKTTADAAKTENTPVETSVDATEKVPVETTAEAAEKASVTAPAESAPETPVAADDQVKACFDYNTDLQELFQTSDGQCFYQLEDAGNYARTLENKVVKTHKR